MQEDSQETWFSKLQYPPVSKNKVPGGQVRNGYSTPFTHWTNPAQPSAATDPEKPSAQQAPPVLLLIVGAEDNVSTCRRLGRALGLEEGCGLTVASMGAPSEEGERLSSRHTLLPRASWTAPDHSPPVSPSEFHKKAPPLHG